MGRMTATPARLLPLDSIATVRGGYAGPEAVTGEPGAGGLRALQARDLSPDGTIAWTSLGWSRPVRDGDRYLINEGDVLLPLRSARPRALVARGVTAGVIAAGQWALITPNAGVAEPDYLAWFLNHPATVARLGRVIQGGTLPFLSLAAIRAFEISAPPLAVQRRIARVSALDERLTLLERQLADARSRLVHVATMNALLHHTDSTDATNV